MVIEFDMGISYYGSERLWCFLSVLERVVFFEIYERFKKIYSFREYR